MLEDCLNSLSAQTYPPSNFEVIVVDGESKDGTEEFVKEYIKIAPYHLIYVKQDKKGICNARNTGIRVSAGNIVCFTDDDCIADKDWLKNLLAGYTDDNVGCVGGDIIAYPPRAIVEKYSEEKKLVSQVFMVCGPVVTSNTSYRREILLDVGGFDEDLCTLEDGDLGIRVKLTKGCNLNYVKNAVIYHRHRSTFRGIIKQQYWYGVGHQRLHKKYLRNFTPEFTLITWPIKITIIILTYPIVIIKSLFTKDKQYYLARPLIWGAITTAESLGILREMFFSNVYPKEKYEYDIPYMREKSFRRLCKYFYKKITPK